MSSWPVHWQPGFLCLLYLCTFTSLNPWAAAGGDKIPPAVREEQVQDHMTTL